VILHVPALKVIQVCSYKVKSSLLLQCHILCVWATDGDGQEVWEEEDNDDSDGVDLDQSQDLPMCQPSFSGKSSEISRASSLLRWLIIFIFSLQAKYHISDHAINVIFQFLYILFSVFARFSPSLSFFAETFPKSRCLAHGHFGTTAKFLKYVVCPKCFSLYSLEESKQKIGSREISKRCTFVAYPMHPQISRRAPCNAILLKSIEMQSGKTLLYPRKIYCYKPLTSSIQNMLHRPGFIEECENWRNRLPGDLSDVYDGRVWRRFQNICGSPFLAARFSYALILNIDWFQP
jgi:hypothetical protein